MQGIVQTLGQTPGEPAQIVEPSGHRKASIGGGGQHADVARRARMPDGKAV
jgi:hypothetical protein